MGLVINTNVSSLITQRNLINKIHKVHSSYEKLASGYRINHSSDDASGLSISDTIRTQIYGNQKAADCTQDGINTLQIAEGALSVISENLQRIRELTVQAASDNNSTAERTAIALEVQSRIDDINRIAASTRSSNIYLLDGSRSSYIIQVGPNSDTNQNTVDISSVLQAAFATSLGLTDTVTVATGGAFENNSSCRTFISNIDAALEEVFDRRANLGALQNRFESDIDNLLTMIENLKSTDSRIRDLNVAKETANLTKNQILQQSTLSILSQTNQSPGYALQLLQ